MLGEELESITISRDYFTNIFNAVSDMVFILNGRGIIEDANKAAEDQLQYEPGMLKGKSINGLQNGSLSYRTIVKYLKENNFLVSRDCVMMSREGVAIPVRVNASYFNEEKNKLLLLTASDVSFQMKTENLIIRAIINTQENERQRLAKDLHDGLAQPLSAIKFFISAIGEDLKNKKQQKVLQKASEALTEVIAEMRNICFNLMPKTLEEFGLVKAVQEFCTHFFYDNKTKFKIDPNQHLPPLSADIKIDLYRVIQEFITNAINHGHADNISISFKYHQKILRINLEDNGKGFDTNNYAGRGMGLQNVQSRVKSHDGELLLTSTIGKGTTYKIAIPIN